MRAYGRIYLSSGLVFVSSLFIWRGLWQALDDLAITGGVCVTISSVSFTALSLWQLALERQRLRDPNGARSPSVYADEIFTMMRPSFDPEQFLDDDSSSASEARDAAGGEPWRSASKSAEAVPGGDAAEEEGQEPEQDSAAADALAMSGNGNAAVRRVP